MAGSSSSRKKTIAQSIKRPGALTKKAQAAGKTIYAFAKANSKGSSLTAVQSRYYLNVLRPSVKRRKKK